MGQNIAGLSTREMARRRRKRAIWISIGIITITGLIWIIGSGASMYGAGGIWALVMLVLLKIVPSLLDPFFDREIKKAKRATRGAIGEEKIGKLLDGIGPDHYVIHDVADPNGNIDHVLISKVHGLITIETKAHGGKVRVDNGILLVNNKPAEKNFFNQSLRNAFWLRKKITSVIGEEPWINQIIVFTNAFVSPSKPYKGITVVNKKFLIATINKYKPNKSTSLLWEKREEIFNILKNS